MQPEDILPPTPTTPVAAQTEDASAADVVTDVLADVVTDMVVNRNRIGPIECVLIRGRGTSRDAEHSVQAVGLTLTQATPPSPWPTGHEEGDTPAPPW